MTGARIRKFFAGYLPWAIIVIGIFLRLRQYFSDRSLWVDEAMLARNILERPLLELLQPLQYEQNAPIGFLLLSKIAALIGGYTAASLRFFPLVFGIAALILFYRVARHFLRTPGTLIALTFFSLASPMVYYSAEYKQYMGDALATLILWYFFLVARPKNKIWLVLLGVIIIWFSHASIIILAALGIADVSLWYYAVPFWIVSFGVNYLVALRYSLSDVTIRLWQGLFIVFPWQKNGNVSTFLSSVSRMFGFFFGLDTAWIHIPVMLFGYVAIARKSIKNIIVLGLPLVLLLIASGFQKYPFVPRLLLFLAPSFYIAIGAAADILISWGRRIGRGMGTVVVMLVLLPLLLWGVVPDAAMALVLPIKVEELEQVLKYLHAHYQKGDQIYIYYGAEGAFRFYAPAYGLDHVPTVVGTDFRANVLGYKKDVSKLKGYPRVWVMFSHIYKQSLFGEDRYIVGFLDEIGKRLDYYPQVGASLYLYDLR